MIQYKLNKLDITFILLFIVALFLSSFTSSVNLITYVCIFEIINFTLYVKLKNIGMISITYIFIILTFITHFGHFFLHTFNIDADIPQYFNVFSNLDINQILNTGKFINAIISTLIIGIIIGNSLPIRTGNKGYLTNKHIIFIGTIFIILGLFFEIYTDYNLIVNYLSGGYLATTHVVQSGILNTFSNFFRYGVLFLMLGYRKHIIKSKLIYVIYNLFLLVPMFSGNRFNSILFMILGAYVYFCVIEKNKSKMLLLKLIILSFFVLTLLNVIADFRQSNLSYIEIAKRIPEYLLENNVIFDALGEFGVTFYSSYYSILCIPLYVSFGYGLTYIASLITVIPNIGNIYSIFERYILYTNNFPSHYRAGLGGSYIGELYYNFGWISILFGLMLGIIIIYIEKKFKTSVYNQQWLNVIRILPLFVILLMWIRGYFREFIRAYCWNILLIYLILLIFNKIKK